MRDNWFVRGLITNFVWWVVAGIGGIVIAFLSKNASAWALPVFYGLIAFAVLSVGMWALRSISKLPRPRVVTSVDNVEALVRTWLNNFRVGVKNDPVAEAFFRIIATMDNGTQLRVGRPRGDLSGYLIVRGDVALTADELRTIAALPQQELSRIIAEIRLELARAKVGYSGLTLPITNVAVFKRIPIGEALTEDSFMAKLEEIEAALLAMAAIAYIRLARNGISTPAIQEGSIRDPLSPLP